MFKIEGDHFVDEQGRRLMLRGVNLGGSSKVPYPDGATYIRKGFFDHRNVSFVGRPFPLDQADEHFRRLRAWGFTFLRLLVTWEAIEHAGPGIYDEEYLDYLRTIVEKAADYGMHCFIDPHQDDWSRFTGGDGAPGWTLEAVGFDLMNLHATGAAIVHAEYGDPFPKMIWPTNEGKLAAATMFTLFFGGNDFAPKTMVNGILVQEFLQSHYISAFKQVALRLKDLSNVVGYDTLNEPLAGFIGWRDLNTNGGELTLGDAPTPFQGMLLGAGLSQKVGVWKMGLLGVRRVSTRWLNKEKIHAWHEGFDCIWRQNGVWDWDTSGEPRLLQPDYFIRVNGREVDFNQDYYRPFANRFATAVRSVDDKALIFLEPEASHALPRWGQEDAKNVVYAPHWYDGFTLIKGYSPFVGVDYFTHKIVFGRRAIKKSFTDQLASFHRKADFYFGGVPTIIGEIGIPFNTNREKGYRKGNFTIQAEAMDRSMQAIEDNLLDITLWNYTADNSNAHGDLWNDEDFSIFSLDQQSNPRDIHSGGRALQAVVRPYPRATAGELVSVFFDPHRRWFEMVFRHDTQTSGPTQIFIPNLQYPNGYQVTVSDGTWEGSRNEQMLAYFHSLDRKEHSICIKPTI